MRYSAFRLFTEALRGNRGWQPAWRDAAPRRAYDAVIVGGGGHGLATAYYLAKVHGLRDIAVLEKGWIGGGNIGRNKHPDLAVAEGRQRALTCALGLVAMDRIGANA